MAAVPALAAAMLIGTTEAPALAATCSGSGCNGKDPAATGCASTASTVATDTFVSTSAYKARVDLRYSSGCRTTWARIVFTASSATSWANPYSDIIPDGAGTTYNCTGVTYSSTLGGYSCYTPMHYDAGNTSHALGGVYFNGTLHLGYTNSY
jgi:Protein of unknown function (DUF2690)